MNYDTDTEGYTSKNTVIHCLVSYRIHLIFLMLLIICLFCHCLWSQERNNIGELKCLFPVLVHTWWEVKITSSPNSFTVVAWSDLAKIPWSWLLRGSFMGLKFHFNSLIETFSLFVTSSHRWFPKRKYYFLNYYLAGKAIAVFAEFYTGIDTITFEPRYHA